MTSVAINLVVDAANERLRAAGVGDRWEEDSNGESNSQGTWWLGDRGGVTRAREITRYTRAAIRRTTGGAS